MVRIAVCLALAGLALPGLGQTPAGPAPAVRGDLDGDGQPDLVVRSYATIGANWVWFMNGTVPTGFSEFTPPMPLGEGRDSDLRVPPTHDWIFCGAGDFDGDGRNDVVLSDEGFGVSGAEIWLLDPGLQRRQAVPLNSAKGCKSVDDFDGDGDPDILFSYGPGGSNPNGLVVWLMQGTTHVGDLVPQPAVGPGGNWKLTGTGDFNADGFPDLLWWNFTSHMTVQWLMDGSMVRTLGRFTNPSDYGDAEPAALVDLGPGPGGSAGVTDIVWRGQTYVPADRACCRAWYMGADGSRLAAVPIWKAGMPSSEMYKPVGPH